MDSCIDKHMDSYIQTKSDEHGSSCNHQKMFSELESKLFAEKQRFQLLQTELKVTKFVATQEAENHKSECLNLKETISRLEVDRSQLREKEAKDKELIKTLFKMVEKYDNEFMEKLNEFMKKYGDEIRSMYKRNDDIYVKKEFDGEMNDEMPNKENDTMMISKKRVIREMWEKENCFAYGFTPFQFGNSAEEKGKNIHRQKKMPKLSDRRSNLIVHIIKAIEELSEDSHDKIAKRLGTGTDGDQDVDSANIGKIQMEKHIQLGLDKS